MFLLLVIYLCLYYILLYLLLTGNKFQTDNYGCMFSTGSIDNDLLSSYHLAKERKAPWWFCQLGYVILTGQYGEDDNIISGVGIRWCDPWSFSHYAKFVVMMIRPNERDICY